VLSAPKSVLDTNFNILRALWLLFLSILIWGRKESLLSKRRPQNLVSEAARPSYIKLLDTVHHQGFRLSLGAFRTSPVESMYVEANEPSLENRRIKLGMQYATKLKALDTNFNILRALWLLFLSILIWGRKESLLSKRRPQNFVSEAILIGELYKVNSGSGWSLSIKINSLAKVLNDNIEGSLYVDDFLICYRGKNMNNIERQFLNVRID
jgi:hypothetical protein